MKSLDTVTTVETGNRLQRDRILINGTVPTTGEELRARVVIDKLRELGGQKTRVRVESRNANVKGKGLGFSASGFAALGLASSKALGLSLEPRELSEVVRLGAGSATRSLVGGFSIWYANRKGRSYAEQLASASSIGLRTLIVPIPSNIKTDRAHADVLTSPFFKARLAYVKGVVQKMRRAIARKDASEVSRLAEVDTLNLHAITMTGRLETVLVSPRYTSFAWRRGSQSGILSTQDPQCSSTRYPRRPRWLRGESKRCLIAYYRLIREDQHRLSLATFFRC